GTVSVFIGAPGTAKAPLTNTLFCAGGCSAAPTPMPDLAEGFTMRSVVFWLGVSEVCALPDTVVATNASAMHAVRKCFIATPPFLSGSSRRVRPKCESWGRHDGTLPLQRTLASWSSRTSLLPACRRPSHI